MVQLDPVPIAVSVDATAQRVMLSGGLAQY